MGDRALAVAMLFVTGIYFYGIMMIPESFISDPLGAKAAPTLVVVMAALASLAILLKPDAKPNWPKPHVFMEILAAGAVMMTYATLLSSLGFVIPSSLAGGYLSWRLGAQAWRACVAGVVIAVGIYVIFHWILGLSLPTGMVGF